MAFETAEVPAGCWGIDCSQKLGHSTAKTLSDTPLPTGPAIRFAWRYVSLPGNSPHGDIDPTEAQAICDAGLILLLVQHCRAGLWTAFGTRGYQDGTQAASHAASVGYPGGACVALDLESVANVGDDVIAHCNEWCRAVKSSGFRPVIYVGFSAGLNAEQLWELPHVDRYWSDFGHRQVAKRGVCCQQYPQITVAGIPVDPDHAFPDQLGGVLVGCANEQPITSV